MSSLASEPFLNEWVHSRTFMLQDHNDWALQPNTHFWLSSLPDERFSWYAAAHITSIPSRNVQGQDHNFDFHTHKHSIERHQISYLTSNSTPPSGYRKHRKESVSKLKCSKIIQSLNAPHTPSLFYVACRKSNSGNIRSLLDSKDINHKERMRPHPWNLHALLRFLRLI